VDAAPAYIAAAREEAGRRDLAERLHVVDGDFVTVAEDLAPADVVAMDRVVCCYPAYGALLEAGLARSRRLFAFSYPRDRWYVRAVIALENLARAVVRNQFRAFVHSAQAMEALIEAEGFARRQRRETLAWTVDLYVREDGRSNAAG
jgi:magnesium-protoporphyrin O-methyltransferase